MEEDQTDFDTSFLGFLPLCCAVLFSVRCTSSMAHFTTPLSRLETYLEKSRSESESSEGGGRWGMVRVVKAKVMTKRSNRDVLSGHVIKFADFLQSRTNLVTFTAQ